MRLTRKKSWSQHQLALKLRMGMHAQTGIFTWERQRLLIHAAKTAMAAALCWLIALRLGLRDGYWASISAIIVLQSNVGATVNASRDRLLGTLIGAALGFAFSLFGPLALSYVLAVLVAMLVCGLLGLRNSSRLAGVTISIVMLVHHGGPHWVLAASRVGEVMLGIVIALGVGTLVFPDRARLRLRDGLAQEYLLLGAFFEAILEGFRGAASPNQGKIREDVQSVLGVNGQMLQASRNEPSGGPGWREGLAMLCQYGASLHDVLLALELSVQDSHEDSFAQKLEPELGKLASDIRNGFTHVAGCIHQWRFDTAPKGYSLEEDIAALESHMDAVRHTGIAFSQADILRAYAVQLHLKQIARLLRASRVQTHQAVRKASE